MSARSDIPATEFPDYVRHMHQESDHRLDQEYKVSTNLKTLVIGVIVSIAPQGIEKMSGTSGKIISIR